LLVLVAVLGLAGAIAALVLRRPPPPPLPVVVAPTAAATDAGLTDEEVFAASMARLVEARRKAEEEAAAEVDAGRRVSEVTPDPRLPRAAVVLESAPSGSASLEAVAAMLRDQDLAGALEQIHALYRTRSPSAPRALELLARELQGRARAGDLARVEPVLPRFEELPTSEASVRSHVARVLGSVALASSKAGQTERSRQEARAALALDESIPEAYLALGEYMFQGNDLAGALDTWEHGLRLNPGNTALARRLERGRSEAQRLGGLERVTSEHFSVAFDGRADVPGARASLEVMEAAYRSVGALFELYPDGPIPVVLYPDRSYEQEGHVSWSAGVYDGKIRLPSAGANTTSLRFRGVLFHEYAHALFQRATGGKGGPAWLNEGYADVAKLVGDPGPAVRCTPDVHSFQLRALEGSFGRIGNHKQAHLAYLEARHAVEHVLERHGQAGLRALFSELSTGAPFATAFERALHEDYATFAATFDAEASR
jgi:tetratricopeptide (TPR) repeat protein